MTCPIHPKYKAIFRPRCECQPCWFQWYEAQRERVPGFKSYVNGFMINPDTKQVLFIEKQRPEFQKGKWNGIGGKIEFGEAPIDAMVREFYEEADVVTKPEDWTHTVSLEGVDFVVHFYRCFVSRFPAFRQTTDEALGLYFLSSVYTGLPTLDNMRWILPMQFTTGLMFPIRAWWKIGDEANLNVKGHPEQTTVNV